MTSEVEQAAVLEEEEKVSNLANQALWVCIHVLIAVGSWAAMMVLITMARPESVPVLITTAATFAVPFLVGFMFTRVKQNEMAPYTWLIGLIWFLVICLWILDMPTGPNQCYHCDASQKIYLTFFSLYEPSGLIDNQGQLIGTWPAIALTAYAIGSSFALKKRKV